MTTQVSDSILNSTKKILGIGSDYTAFDLDILTHINSVFATLNQLGIGPDEGFEVTDADTAWSGFLGDSPDLRMNSVKTYLYLKVRSIFDPPTTSYAIEAMNKQIAEYEWRLNVKYENDTWVDTDTIVVEGG